MAGRVVRGMDEGGIPGVAAEMYDAAQPGMRFIGGVGRQALNNVGDGVAYLGGGRPAVEAQIQERIQSKAPGTGGVPIMMYAPWGATAVQPVADSGYEVESSATGVQSAPPVNPGEANERSRAAIAQYFDAGSNGALNLERGGTARFSRDNLPLGTSARGAGVPEMYTIQHPNGGTVQVPADQVEKLLPVLLGEKSNDITGQPENKEDFMNKARVGVRRRVDKNNSLPMGVKWAKDHPEEAAAAKERIAKGQGTHRDYWMAGSVKGQSGEEKRVDQMNYEAVQRMARREAAQQTDASEDKRHKNKLEEIAAGKTPKSEPASSKQLKSRNFTYKGDDGKDVSGKLDYTFDPKSGETVPKYTVEQQNLVDGWLDELANLEALEKQGKKKAPGKIKGVNPTIEERRATLNERLSGFGYVTDSSIRAAIPDVTEEELKSIRGALRRGQTLDQILNSSK
ncbi:MAG: hypothetical protein JXR25_11825 [Pontiellaceae bacterium]|nr:hypothetical protein [Pontiellaceae bacterium]